MRYWKILLISCFLVNCKSSNNTESISRLDAICIPVIDSFFHKIESNNYKAALDDLLSSNENFDLKDSSTIDLQDKFSNINRFSGVYRGNSLIKKKSINDDIVAYSYLAKYDKRFYRFVFVFYNNGIRTKIYKFMFDDSAGQEIEESLKLYM
jgi:hypothetical protein